MEVLMMVINASGAVEKPPPHMVFACACSEELEGSLVMRIKSIRVRKQPYTAFLGVVASIVVLVSVAIFTHDACAGSLPKDVVAMDHRPMPALEIYKSDGKLKQFPEKLGKATIVHFWASWCAPCITELPALDAFAAKYKKQGVNFVVVSLDSKANQAKAAAFYKSRRIKHLPLLYASQMSVMKQLELKGLPTTFFVVNGKQVARADADLAWGEKDMANYVDGLLLMK
jgi:thiol-disulfide isomerase/thioredoxin